MAKNQGNEPVAIVPPDGGWGWVVMFASFLCNMIVDGIVFNFSPFSGPIQNLTGAGTAEVAFVGSLLAGFYLTAGPFVTGLSDRLGFRWVTIIGCIIASCAFATCYYVENIYVFYLVYGVIGGIGVCFIFVSSVLTVGYYFDKWRALATGIALCGSGIGTSVFAQVFPIIIEKKGVKWGFLAQGIICMSCCIFALAFHPLKAAVINTEFLQTKPEHVRKTLQAFASNNSLESKSGRKTVVRAHVPAESKRKTFVEDMFFSGSMATLQEQEAEKSLIKRILGGFIDISLFKSPCFVLLALSGFLTMMGFFVPFAYATPRAEKAGLEKSAALFIVTMIGISNTIARVVCGVITSLNITALHLNNVAIIAGGIATMLSGLLMQNWAQLVYAVIFGICIASFSALRSTIVVDMLGVEQLTSAFGALMLFQGLAAIFGTPLAGLIYEATKGYDVPFFVAGGLLTLSGVILIPLECINRWEKRRDAQKQSAA